MEAPHPAPETSSHAHHAEGVNALRQALPRLNSSKAINMWVEIRTFKALYSALRRVAGDIFLKYIDASSGSIEMPSDVRTRIREKALMYADKTLSYDTFDEAREYVVHNLDRELGGSRPERAVSDPPQTIIFPMQTKKGHQKQREMFGFLSDGDEEPDQSQLLRSERKKVAEMSEALTAWYGPGWESELKRRKKELKARAREAGKEKERLEDEERRERERRKKEEVFPGVPLHSEQDSLEKLKKRVATPEAPAFPGIPMYDERQRPRPDTLRKLGSSEAIHQLQPIAPEGVPDELASPNSSGSGGSITSTPGLKKDKDRDSRRNLTTPLQKDEELHAAGSSPPAAAPPASRSGIGKPFAPVVPKTTSASAAPPLEEQQQVVARESAATTSEENRPAFNTPSHGVARVSSSNVSPESAFPGIPLHLVDDRPGASARREARAKSVSPSAGRPTSAKK